MKTVVAAISAIALTAPATAQMDHSSMQMPAKPVAKPKPPVQAKPATSVSKPAAKAAQKPVANPKPVAVDPHAGHSMPPVVPVIAGESLPTPAADPQVGQDMPALAMEAGEIGDTPAPAPPSDHAADTIFGPADMARARAALLHEHGGLTMSMLQFNLAEYQARPGSDGYRWEGEGWLGGDINRFVVKTEGDLAFGGAVDKAEFQALYSRAINPWFNVQAGVRHDIRPDPQRTYATLGIEGLAPYWFKVGGAFFLSTKGDLLGRVEGYYDQRITQRLILQPRAEMDLSAQNIAATGVGSGLTDVELGLRLRYEIKKEFAPYLGVEWARKVGDTARYARLAGEDPDVTNFVVGVRFWF